MLFKDTTIEDCRIIQLGMIHNKAGSITVIERDNPINFFVRRVYYLYDVPGGAERGGHAHKDLQQLIVAASGSFEVKLDDGKMQKSFYLNHPNTGLYVIKGIWRELVNFSSGSICLVLASEIYSASDYIREYNDYIKYKNDPSLI
jgi:hypothetical protein